MVATAVRSARTRKYTPTCQRDRKAAVLVWSVTGVGLVRVTESGKDTHYHLTELASGFPGRAFKVEKHGHEEESSYDVVVNGKQSSCECLGFLRHRHCRHCEFLVALVGTGKL
jgi:hypothetical protein